MASIKMGKKDIKYNPSWSISDNAKKNGVSEASIRHYIRTELVDRRYDRKQGIIDDCRRYLIKHPNATRTELQIKTGHSLTTIRKYWKYISTEEGLTDFDKNKAKKYQLKQQNNWYATHPSVTQDLMRVERFHSRILEPFCGSGTMAEVIKSNGYDVVAFDMIDRGYGNVGEFFSTDYPRGEYDIITNPPYSDNLIEIVKRCISLCKNKVAILMPMLFLSGKTRYEELYTQFPPSRVYIYCERINIAKEADFNTYSDRGMNLTIYAWYIWEKAYNGVPELKWIHNEK